MEIWIPIVIGIVCLAAGFAGGYVYRRNIAEAKIANAEEAVKKMIGDAQKRAETIKKETVLEAKEEKRNCDNAANDCDDEIGPSQVAHHACACIRFYFEKRGTALIDVDVCALEESKHVLILVRLRLNERADVFNAPEHIEERSVACNDLRAVHRVHKGLNCGDRCVVGCRDCLSDNRSENGDDTCARRAEQTSDREQVAATIRIVAHCG